MDLSVEEFITNLLSKEPTEEPTDSQPDKVEIAIPEWYDEKQFNQARRFYWDNCFQFSFSMLLGLVAVFAIPSILTILISTRRSNSVYTSYKRYLSTILHTVSWFEHELKPGSISWKSLKAVRTRHVKSSLGAQMKGLGIISQRDLALTQFGFIGISIIKPDKFGIRQLQPGDWENYNHFWRTIGHAIGLKDRYNICRATFEETRQVCHILNERVFRPCLTNVPEYFEHMSRSLLDAMWCVNPTVNIDGLLYLTKHIVGVPGYIYTEDERASLQTKIKEMLKGQSVDIGVDINKFVEEPAIEGYVKTSSRSLYLCDYDSIESVPEYQRLAVAGKYKLAVNYATAFPRFGYLASFVNIFEEDPTDNAEVKPNSEYYKPKPKTKPSWYRAYLPF